MNSVARNPMIHVKVKICIVRRPQNLKKKSHLFSNIKISKTFFQILVAFLENLYFKKIYMFFLILTVLHMDKSKPFSNSFIRI